MTHCLNQNYPHNEIIQNVHFSHHLSLLQHNETITRPPIIKTMKHNKTSK